MLTVFTSFTGLDPLRGKLIEELFHPLDPVELDGPFDFKLNEEQIT